jgi:hypothetical protein
MVSKLDQMKLKSRETRLRESALIQYYLLRKCGASREEMIATHVAETARSKPRFELAVWIGSWLLQLKMIV